MKRSESHENSVGRGLMNMAALLGKSCVTIDGATKQTATVSNNMLYVLHHHIRSFFNSYCFYMD